MLTRRRMIAAGAVLLPAGWAPTSFAAAAGSIVVHKDPSCGCCGLWADRLRQAGFIVEERETETINRIKRQAGVPGALSSCHTAFLDGYVLEGHVPVVAIRKLLDARPAILGLAVPGMPAGSPGMESGVPEAYDVIGFAAGGRPFVFHEVRPA